MDLHGVCVSSPRSRAAAFDLLVFGLAGQHIVSFHSLRGCVQTVEWAGRASQAKIQQETSCSHLPGTASTGWAGGHPCICVATCPTWCSVLRHEVGERTSNVVDKLPAGGKSVGGKLSRSGAGSARLSLPRGEARSSVSSLTAPPPNCSLQAQFL